MAFTETWLSSDTLDSEVRIPGYHLCRADRQGGRTGGGVILYWNADLKAHLVESTCDGNGGFEALWCRVHDGRRNLTIAVVYRAPLGSGARLLDSIKTHGTGKDCVLVGDFNTPGVDWDLLHCATSSDVFAADFLETVLECNLFQHVTVPTRVFVGQTPRILDLVLSPAQSDVADITILPPIGKSDHSVVSFLWTRRLTLHNQDKFRRNFWRADPIRLQTTASAVDWNIPQPSDADEEWNILYSRLISLVEQTVPYCKRRTFTRGPPWIDRELRCLMTKRRKLWDRFKLTHCALDYSVYKEIRNDCNLKKRQKRCQYELSLAVQSRTTPKALYSYLKRSTKAGSGIPALFSSEQVSLLDDDGAKASLFALQYSSVYSLETPLPGDTTPIHPSPLIHVEMSVDDVAKGLRDLDPNSSPGPDGLHPLFLKTVADCIAAPVCQLFRHSLQAGRLPVAWKLGTVKPIYKGGDRHDPANYRPICLTSVLCKLMERILKRALHLHFENLNIISSAQHGFRRAHSCTSNLLVAREKWAKLLDAGKRLDVVFVDFSKAFDKVPHERLLFKLQGTGVSGNVLSWIADFLAGRTMRVKVNEAYSAPVLMTSGVPQGSVLGPELFKIFINDLPSELQLDCLIYADDLKLWMEVSCLEDADRLQTSLDMLHEWSTKWRLPINREKCSVLSIGAPEPFGAYHIGGVLLRTTILEKDLGVLVSHDLRTTEDTLRRVAAASRMSHAIRRAFSRLTPDVFRILFTSHVRPILEYGLPATYPLTKFECCLIEKVQRRASKSILELRDLPYPLRLQRMHLFSLEYRRRRGDLIFTRRILRGEMGMELQAFFQVNANSSTRGHDWKLFKPRRLKVRSALALSTRVVNDWNGLPKHVADAQTEECFKRFLDSHLMSKLGPCFYQCSCFGPSWNTVS